MLARQLGDEDRCAALQALQRGEEAVLQGATDRALLSRPDGEGKEDGLRGGVLELEVCTTR
jgi:hypothetical protein